MSSDRSPLAPKPHPNPSQCGPEATPDPLTRAKDLPNTDEEAEPREEKGGHRPHQWPAELGLEPQPGLTSSHWLSLPIGQVTDGLQLHQVQRERPP